MGAVIIGATLSLDGFMNDRHGDVGRLYPDLPDLRYTEMLREEIQMTGAVVMGRHAYDMAHGNLTGYEYQVPIFVLTHHPPAEQPQGQNERLTVAFVAESVERCIARAQLAAGDKQVTVVGGAATAQQCLRAGLVDELHLGIVPIVLGAGLRFFDPDIDQQLRLERTRVYTTPTRTDLWFRVVR